MVFYELDGFTSLWTPKTSFSTDILLGWTDKFKKGKVTFRWNHIRRVSFFVVFFNFKDEFMYSSYGYN